MYQLFLKTCGMTSRFKGWEGCRRDGAVDGEKNASLECYIRETESLCMFLGTWNSDECYERRFD